MKSSLTLKEPDPVTSIASEHEGEIHLDGPVSMEPSQRPEDAIELLPTDVAASTSFTIERHSL